MQIWAEPEKSALPICNYSQILYQFLTFTQNLKGSPDKADKIFIDYFVTNNIEIKTRGDFLNSFY